MGIRFQCPNGHKLNVKSFLAGKRGVCPKCGAKFVIPSTEEALTVGAAIPPDDALSSDAGSDGDAVMIEVVESPGSVVPVMRPPATMPVPQSPAVQLPEVNLAAVPTPRTSQSVSIYAVRQRRNRQLQMKLAVVLLLVVVVLAVVLVWVLSRKPSEATTQGARRSRLVTSLTETYVADAATLPPFHVATRRA